MMMFHNNNNINIANNNNKHQKHLRDKERHTKALRTPSSSPASQPFSQPTNQHRLRSHHRDHHQRFFRATKSVTYLGIEYFWSIARPSTRFQHSPTHSAPTPPIGGGLRRHIKSVVCLATFAYYIRR